MDKQIIKWQFEANVRLVQNFDPPRPLPCMMLHRGLGGRGYEHNYNDPNNVLNMPNDERIDNFVAFYRRFVVDLIEEQPQS